MAEATALKEPEAPEQRSVNVSGWDSWTKEAGPTVNGCDAVARSPGEKLAIVVVALRGACCATKVP